MKAIAHASCVFGSRFASLELAERMLGDLGADAGIDEAELYPAQIALREALANAILHAHGRRAELPVELEIIIDESVIRLEVSDRGKGFSPADVPDPTSPENLLRPGGRGIFCMRQFMDRNEFHQREGGGTRVVLERDRATGSNNEDLK